MKKVFTLQSAFQSQAFCRKQICTVDSVYIQWCDTMYIRVKQWRDCQWKLQQEMGKFISRVPFICCISAHSQQYASAYWYNTHRERVAAICEIWKVVYILQLSQITQLQAVIIGQVVAERNAPLLYGDDCHCDALFPVTGERALLAFVFYRQPLPKHFL
jgi:hypothetical protein